VLPGADRAGACEVAERVRSAVSARPIREGTLTVDVSTSIGAACTGDTGYDAPALIHRADAALYRAKASGRDCVVAAR